MLKLLIFVINWELNNLFKMETEILQTKKITTAPKLRFEEFQDDWQIRKFGEITTKVGSGSTPRGGREVYKQSGIPFIRSQNVIQNQLVLDDTFISEEINEQMKGSIVQPNDVLLNITGASIGRSCHVPHDFKIGNVNQHVCIIRLQNQYDPKFIQLFLSSEKGQRLIYKGQTGSGREGLNFQSIRLFRSRLPRLSEQQKIASFLSAVDKKIQQLTCKKAFLETYKKGVMQKLFSQEIRFKPVLNEAEENKEVRDYPEWEFRKLNQFVTPLKRKVDQPTNVVLSISAGKGFLHQEERFNQIIAGSSLEKYTLLKKNEFSYNRGNSKTYTYGCIYKLTDYDEALVPNIYRSFKLKDGDPEFFEQLFISKYLDRQLRRLISSSARMDGLLNIGQEDFYKCKVPFPCVQEQKQIGKFLKKIDCKIEAVSQQIEKTQTFKKGLLQQMLV